jgi:hypothetical protein
MAPPKKYNLEVAIDPGASCTKAIGVYKESDDERSVALILSPHFLEIESKALDQFITALPTEKRCWIKHGSQTYAVGDLGKRFGGIAPFRPLKADSAGIKVIGALAAVVHKLGLAGKRINGIRLTYLLPPGEYVDHKRVTDWLIEALKGFESAYGKISFQSHQIAVRPEGFGVLEFCKEKEYLGSGRSTLLMGGHRNISMYSIDAGVAVEKFTFDRGFNDWVKAIDSQTSGYSGDLDVLGSLIAAYCSSKNPDSGIFSSILRRQSAKERQEETDLLLEVIDRTRGTFWKSIAGWLQENYNKNSQAVVLAGGMAHVFSKEFTNHFRPLLPDRQDGVLGKALFLDRDLLAIQEIDCLNEIAPEYCSRFIDVYCALKYL